jgi:hypothetical protein
MKQVFSFIAAMLAMIMICHAQANRQLSNLTSPTAVNVDLLPGGTTGTKNFGSYTKRWESGYFNGTVFCYGVGGSYGVFGVGNSYGIYGFSTLYGVYGVGNSYGVYGFGGQYGVVGRGSSMGVRGVSDGVAVHGEGGTYGVTGSGSTYGVWGSGTWAGYFLGKVYASGGYYTSDQKLKQNIRDFTSAMDVINKLKPKQYEFRQDGNYKLMNLPQGSHYGLIAQDVEKILPDLVMDTKFETAMTRPPAPEAGSQQTQESGKTVTQSEIIEFKALNYTELIPVLIKGMQELSTINNEKDTRINAQQKQINELQKQIDELKAIFLRNNPQTGTTTKIANASLAQNVPNPFTNATTIRYTLPSKFTSAQTIITEKNGKQLKQLNISDKGNGTLHVDASTLSSGTYNYSLVIDRKIINTKQMVVAK